MQPIIAHTSRAKLRRTVGIAFALGISGAMLWRLDSSSTWALLCFCIGFLGISTSIRPLLVRGRRITIDDRGIVDHMLRYGVVEWSDIESVSLKKQSLFGLFENTIVILQLRDRTKYIDRLPAYVRPLVRSVFLNLTAIDVKPEEIVSVIDRELSARASSNPSYVGAGPTGRTTARP